MSKRLYRDPKRSEKLFNSLVEKGFFTKNIVLYLAQCFISVSHRKIYLEFKIELSQNGPVGEMVRNGGRSAQSRIIIEKYSTSVFNYILFQTYWCLVHIS